MPLLSTFGAASARGWIPRGNPPKTVKAVAIGGGATGGNGGNNSYLGGNAGLVDVNQNSSLGASGSVIVGAAGSYSSFNGVTGSAGTGLQGSVSSYSSYQYWTDGYYTTTVNATFGTNFAFWFMGYYWGQFPYYGAGNSFGQVANYTLNGVKKAQHGKSWASDVINYFGTVWGDYFGQTSVWVQYDATDNSPYVANSGSGGGYAAQAGYSGLVYIEYPATFDKLTATTGTVEYALLNGMHTYTWTTSGGYTV